MGIAPPVHGEAAFGEFPILAENIIPRGEMSFWFQTPRGKLTQSSREAEKSTLLCCSA
jgi:hypothetical protein